MAHLTSDPAISLDGFIAGPDQNLEHPLGVGGEALHRWHFERGTEEHAAEIEAICSAGASSWAATCSARSAANGT